MSLQRTAEDSSGSRSPGALAARGAAILLAVRGALYVAAVVQSIVVARWIAPAEVGIYALGLAIVAVLGRIKQVGAPEKLVRDSESEFVETFPAAFATQLCLSTLAFVLLAVVCAGLSGLLLEPRLVLVTVALGVTLFQQPAELPAILFFRHMDFVKPGLRQVLASAVALGATVVFAVAGWGVWALVLGQVAGVAVTAIVFWGFPAGSLPLRPIRVHAVRAFALFGLPVWGMGLLAVAAERGTTFAVSSVLGLTVLGYVHIAQSLSNRLVQASQAVSSALFPVLRTVGDDSVRLGGLVEQSNRMLALGALPLGTGLALFSVELVPFLFGEKWESAAPFVAMYCLLWGLGMIGHASYLPFLVQGDTKAPAAYGSANLVAKLVLTVIGVVWFGVEGFLVAMGLSILVALVAQTRMIRRLFPSVSLLAGSARTVWITAAAVAAVRALEASPWLGADPLAVRMMTYGAVVTAGTLCFQRTLFAKVLTALREGFLAARVEERANVSTTGARRP